jgi:hypothetical protein
MSVRWSLTRHIIASKVGIAGGHTCPTTLVVSFPPPPIGYYWFLKSANFGFLSKLMLRKLQKRREIALEYTTVSPSIIWGGVGGGVMNGMGTRERAPLPLIPSSLQEILLAFGGRNKLLAVIRKVCVPQSRT